MSAGLAQRHRVPEVMDDPGLDRASHEAALAGLARLNRLAAPGRAIWRGLRQRLGAHEPLRILDLACGSGDVGLDVAQQAAAEGIFVELVGCDLSEVAIDTASAAKVPGRVEARFATCDVLDLDALREVEAEPHVVMTKGMNIINPTATLVSAGMMLDYLGFAEASGNLTAAISQVYREGDALTPDQGGNASTTDFCHAVKEYLS